MSVVAFSRPVSRPARPFGVAVCVLWALSLLVGCEPAAVATPPPTTITIVGATSTRLVMTELTAEFSRQHPNVLFSLRGGGSTLGEAAAANGEVDLAVSTLFPPELDSDATPVALVRIPFGLDGLAVIVHASNPVAALSLVQLQDLFNGRVLDWQALGSDAGEVLLVSREDGSGSRLLFEQRVMGEARVSLTAVVMPTSQDVVDYVARHPGAIGYVTRAEVVEMVEPPAESSVRATSSTTSPVRVKVVTVEGLLPTVEALRSQRYALTQPLYLVSQRPPGGRVRQFVDFVLSPAGQAMVGRYHAPIR